MSRMVVRNGLRRLSHDLRLRLLVFDLAGLGTAAVLTVVLGSNHPAWTPLRSTLYVVAALACGLTFARWQGLYQASRGRMRSVELTGIVRVAALLGVAGAIVGEFVGTGPDLARSGLLAVLSIAFLAFTRSLFRAWLRARRAAGDFLRPVVVVGADQDGARIVDILRDHRDLGFAVVGVCSDVDDARAAGLQRLWRGEVDKAVSLVRDGQVTGAIVVASALDPRTLNRVVRDLATAGGHVHISSGLHGLASDRIVSESIAHEPLLHIHPWHLDPRQAVTKRIVDVALSSTLLVLTAPVLLLAMLLVKVADGGPALFQQVRVGRDNVPFRLLKLRTMKPGAEDHVGALQAENLRTGPLFKVDNDPRVTTIGRFLRATSIDELPQLWNVLRGEMSLVGPRPALPAEVEEFPAQLAERTNVLPGLTGLWQVEARDNPSFEAYARLDLFYIENWTLTLDLVILVATIESEISRLISALLRRRRPATPGRAPAPPVDVPIELLPAERPVRPPRTALVD